MEALDELLGVGEVALEHPVHRPIAEADLPQLFHPRDEAQHIGGEHSIGE
ncbi:MAG TPA: hypothetical protein VKC63_01335 [Solirubrobacterales bacterium]|nr:hypothetical protein [Solirubrobacterales bacterium]